MLLVQRVMKARDNISSDGYLLSLCGKPPTVSNTCLTNPPPHIADLVVLLRRRPSFESGWRIILIGLLNSGMISVLLTENYRLCGFLVLPSRTCKWIMISLLIQGRSGSLSVWVKRKEENKSLISLFAFHCPVFGKGSSTPGIEAWGADTGGVVSSGSSKV